MSVREFTKRVGVADFGKADKQWFPAWLKRYAEFAQHDGRSVIPLTRELAVGFSRELLASQVPAWPTAAGCPSPGGLPEIWYSKRISRCCPTWSENWDLWPNRKHPLVSMEVPDSRDVRQLIGQIDSSESLVIQQLRRELRVQGKALQTERALRRLGQTLPPLLRSVRTNG